MGFPIPHHLSQILFDQIVHFQMAIYYKLYLI